MVLVLNLSDNVFKDLEQDVKDFNLTAYDMNCDSISIPDYVVWLIRNDIAEHKKMRCENEKKRTQKN